MEAMYTNKPDVFSKSYSATTYRWDIEETFDEDNKSNGWKCNEVTIPRPEVREVLIQNVIHSLWDSDVEKKLINDYNEAIILANNDEAIIRYTEFLEEKARVKNQVNKDFKNINL